MLFCLDLLVVTINEKILDLVIGVTLCIIAFVLFNKDKLGIREHKLSRKHFCLLFISMVPLGIYAGFFGAGFGVFITIALVLFGFSFIEGAAIGRVIGACTSIAGAIIFARHGLINYTYGFVLGAGFAIGSWIGIHIALKKDDNYIKWLILFVVFLSILKLILGFFSIKNF